MIRIRIRERGGVEPPVDPTVCDILGKLKEKFHHPSFTWGTNVNTGVQPYVISNREVKNYMCEKSSISFRGKRVRHIHAACSEAHPRKEDLSYPAGVWFQTPAGWHFFDSGSRCCSLPSPRDRTNRDDEFFILNSEFWIVYPERSRCIGRVEGLLSSVFFWFCS